MVSFPGEEMITFISSISRLLTIMSSVGRGVVPESHVEPVFQLPSETELIIAELTLLMFIKII